MLTISRAVQGPLSREGDGGNALRKFGGASCEA
jgi:hypothetical protein